MNKYDKALTHFLKIYSSERWDNYDSKKILTFIIYSYII